MKRFLPVLVVILTVGAAYSISIPAVIASHVTADTSSRARTYHFRNATGVALDSRGDIYVADSNRLTDAKSKALVVKLSPTGKLLARWGRYGTGRGQMHRPMGMAVDGKSNVYVVDASLNRVLKFSTRGKVLAMWGSSGTEPGQFDEPDGIALDRAGNVYVADTYNNRIQIFSPAGKLQTSWGKRGEAPGDFYLPTDIAFDAQGNLYVSDSHNSRVQKLSPTGQFLAAWGTFGSQSGQFDAPGSIAVDHSGVIYVADVTGRIQKLSADGTVVAVWPGFDIPGNGLGLTPDTHLAVDSHNNLYVTNTRKGQLAELSPAGRVLMSWT